MSSLMSTDQIRVPLVVGGTKPELKEIEARILQERGRISLLWIASQGLKSCVLQFILHLLAIENYMIGDSYQFLQVHPERCLCILDRKPFRIINWKKIIYNGNYRKLSLLFFFK
jgi:hypothetical protein